MGQRGKHFRRGLSILLSLLMILGAVPLFSFAADLADVVEVYAKSADYVYITRQMPEQEAPFTVGDKLGDLELKKTGAQLKFINQETGKTTICAASFLVAEFVNKDDVVKQAGTNTELVQITYTKDPAVWVQIWYTFEAVEGSGISPAEITEYPVVSSAKYVENMTASNLELTGGKANVAGQFDFTEPDRAVSPATTEVSVTFTPDDPTSAEAVTFTVPVTIEMGVIEIEEMPVFQYIYKANTQLEDLNLDWDDVVEPGKVSPSGSELDFGTRNVSGGVTSEDAKQNMTVGDHTVNVWVIPTGRYFGGSLEGLYEGSWHDVIVRILPNTTTALPLSAVVTEDNTLQLSVNYSTSQYGTTCNGTVTYKVNGEVVAEGQKIDAVVTYPITESGSYAIEAVYTPAEGDGFHFLPASVTREVVLPHTVTVEGGSGSGSYRPGDTVRVDFDTTLLGKYDVFNGWVITNAEGETLDVGVDLTQRTISFTMPDEAVTITADTSFSIQLFFQSIGEAILNFLMKVVEWFMGLFAGLGSLVG